MSEHGSVLLYVHRNHKACQDGQPRTATSTLNYENMRTKSFKDIPLVAFMYSVFACMPGELHMCDVF